ncbi:MAG: SDR family NAD(P)-dependent oxidoreductase [Kiritimatiellia bacterium]
MGSRVLVTGAGGFIGSHLVDMLVREGYQVRALVRYNSQNSWHNLDHLPKEVLSSVEVIVGDVTDAFAMDKAVQGCEMVFHLAALIGIPYSYIAPAAYVATNVVGTLHVLEACRRHGARLIHTSTSETYGTAQYVPIDEKHPLVGQSPYSASKIGADKLVESYYLSFDLPMCIVRPFNTYGPRQSARAVIPTIITQALTHGELDLGNLDPVRDLTFVTDTARGFVAAARSDRVLGQVVNLGVGVGFSVGEVVAKVGTILGMELVPRRDVARVRPEKSEVQRLISDNSRMRQDTGWSPQVDLDSGLRQTIEYIRANLEAYRVDSYVV